MTPYLGMYVHMHWAYNHPYAARTWTLEDWRGYASGLRRLGYNMVLLWPVFDTMPDPLTASDRAHLGRIRGVIDLLHDEFGMAVMVTAGPNCIGNNAAAHYTFEERPFFKTELRLNPGDPRELARLISFRRELIEEYMAKVDGLAVIDSDPGGCIGSTNEEFVNLLWAHLDILEEVNPSATLYYWMWFGWERYNRYWQWVQGNEVPELTPKEDWAEVIEGLLKQPERRWAVMSCNSNHHPLIERFGIGSRALYNPYGTVEMEPSVPLTNYSPGAVEQALALPERLGMQLGTMANCQTHVAQLPQTYLFSHFARDGTLKSLDLLGFAEELLPGCATLLTEAWETIGSEDPRSQRRAATAVEAAAAGCFRKGPCSGMLFGNPRRYLEDLSMQLRFRADMLDFARAVGEGREWQTTLSTLHASWSAWQARTGFADWFMGPVDDTLYAPLKALHRAEIDPILADMHDWRKLTCRHGIQLGLLDGIKEVLGKVGREPDGHMP